MRTDIGMVRLNNEDAIYADPGIGLMLLADGMGGYNAGEIASSMAISMIAAEIEKNLSNGIAEQNEEFNDEIVEQPQNGIEAAHDGDAPDDEPPESEEGPSFTKRCLHNAITDANAAIFEAAAQDPECGGMGTTVVCAWFFDNRITVAHAGDSRLYRLRANEFEQMTRDHSVLQEYLDNGLLSPEEAPFFMYRNLVTRALGVDAHIEPEIHEYDVLPEDIYLLCSDGLSEMLGNEDIAVTLAEHADNLENAATKLVDLAVDNGGRDNISLILIQVLRSFPSPHRGWRKLIGSWFQNS